MNEVFDSESLHALNGNHGGWPCAVFNSRSIKGRECACLWLLNYVKGVLAIAHNGNLTNAIELRHELAAHRSDLSDDH